MKFNSDWETIPDSRSLPGDLGPINVSRRGDIGVWWKNGGRWHLWNRWHDGSIQEASGPTMSDVRRQVQEMRRNTR